MIAETNKLPRLSASKLKMYLQCPKMYKFRYITKGEERPNIYALHGSALHKAIELYYRENKNVYETYNEKMTKYAYASNLIGAEHYGRLYSEGVAILDTYNPSWYTPKLLEDKPMVEYHFRLPYPNKSAAICTLEGYVDLIEDTGIVDYKSSKEKYTKKKVEEDIQFITYYWLFTQLYNKAPERIVYHRLNQHIQIEGTDFDTQVLDAVITKILNDSLEFENDTLCNSCKPWCGLKILKDEQNALHKVSDT